MTNGEKLKETFPNIDSRLEPKTGIMLVKWVDDTTKCFKASWWGSEYKKPTTKNDLGVDCINRDNAIKALDYDIKRFEFKRGISRHMDDIAKLLNTIYENQVNNIKALPSVTPQEPRKGHWIVQPSNKEQGERDFIWWKCSECGQVIFSEIEHDRLEFHAFCGRCGADMRESEVNT